MFDNVILVMFLKYYKNTCGWKSVIEMHIVLFKQRKLLFKQRYQPDLKCIIFYLMHTKELDMLIIQVEMELNLHKTLCHFLVAQLQDLEPNVSRKH